MTALDSMRTERLAMPASNRSIPFLPVPSSPSRTLRSRLRFAPFLLGAAAALTLSACGTSATSTASQSAAATASPSAAAAGGSSPRAAARGPAASGLIAAVSGSTLQVENAQVGQVAVTWTTATKFTQQVTLSLGSIKAGDCVTASAAAGSPTAASFTATAVTVSQAVNGRCFGGFGAGAFPSAGSSFQPRPRPSGTRSFARPSGGAVRTGAFATGSVVSVSGSTIVVAARTFGPGTGASPSASAGTTTNKTVTLTSATKITTVQSATAAAATVGRCVTAQGTTDSTGAVTATTIAVTDPVNGQCTTGFGGFGAGGRRGQAATTGGTSA
jgi:hypothetical protein